MLFNEGQIIRNTYEIDRFLGEGAFGEVYRVQHKFLGRQAMKVFKTYSNSLKEIEGKLNEAIILSKIGHPNIIRVFDAGVVDTNIGQCGYFTMEYVAGGSLDTFWSSHRGKHVNISDAVNIICQSCMGLAVAHSEHPPIIHRDVKPQNILVGYDPNGLRIRVSDFGLAKKVNPMTMVASARGTPAFKPPEARTNVDSCAGDVWALGVTFYLLLTDRLPFPIKCEEDFVTGKCWKQPISQTSYYNIQVDPLVDSIISRALSINPSDRYPDAKQMLDDLLKWTPQDNCASDDHNVDSKKGALGSFKQAKKASIQAMINEAIRLSQNVGKLMEAADLLEEALNRYPEFRNQYEYQLKLWRRGIVV